MALSDRIRSITCLLRAHAGEIVRAVGDRTEPSIITRNGEGTVVPQDTPSHERMQERLALLKMLALGRPSDRSWQGEPAADVVARLRERQRG